MSRWLHTKSVHKNNWRFRCTVCDYGTAQESLYNNHMKKHDAPSSMRCGTCDQEFKSWWRFEVHNKIHQKSLKCEVCQKQFDKRKNLLRHVSRNHVVRKERDVPCPVCSKMFYDKWALRVHMEVHSDKKEQCPYCLYTTCHPKNMRAHVKVHVKQFDYVCEKCGRGFVYNFLLRDHRLKEHGDGVPRIPCNVCGKTFASQTYLNVHKMSHQPGYENRNHQCGVCAKKFLTRSMLLRHVRGHSRVVEYICRFCSKVLSCLATLKDHEKIHTGEKPFICEICGRSFAAKRYLITHVRTHTNDKPYTCNSCGSCFTQRGTLSAHIRAHCQTMKIACT